jgi:GNAT superfamily N-acetyltransferase
MFHASLELAQRVESMDAFINAEYARTYEQLFGGDGQPAVEVAGGWASFAGLDSPMTQAFGIGMKGEVTATDLETLEEFYRSRGSAVNVEVCPYSDPSLIEGLGRRGYRPIEFSNVHALPLEQGSDRNPVNQKRDSIRIRIASAGEEPLWSQVLTEGFLEGNPVEQKWLDCFKAFFHVPAVVCFIAECEGQDAAGGLMSVYDGVASLATTTTIHRFRGRGAQAALLEARLSYARDHRCDLAMVTTMPGTISQRNVERSEFRTIYTRCKFIREW